MEVEWEGDVAFGLIRVRCRLLSDRLELYLSFPGHMHVMCGDEGACGGEVSAVISIPVHAGDGAWASLPGLRAALYSAGMNPDAVPDVAAGIAHWLMAQEALRLLEEGVAEPQEEAEEAEEEEETPLVKRGFIRLREEGETGKGGEEGGG